MYRNVPKKVTANHLAFHQIFIYVNDGVATFLDWKTWTNKKIPSLKRDRIAVGTVLVPTHGETVWLIRTPRFMNPFFKAPLKRIRVFLLEGSTLLRVLSGELLSPQKPTTQSS